MSLSELNDSATQLKIKQHSIGQLTRLLQTQVVLLVCSTGVAWIFFGTHAALSLFAGGLAYLLPSALVFMSFIFKIYIDRTSMLTFFLGEGFKVIGAIALMLLIVVYAGKLLVWPAFLIGLIIVLKGYLLVLTRD